MFAFAYCIRGLGFLNSGFLCATYTGVIWSSLGLPVGAGVWEIDTNLRSITASAVTKQVLCRSPVLCFSQHSETVWQGNLDYWMIKIMLYGCSLGGDQEGM